MSTVLQFAVAIIVVTLAVLFGGADLFNRYRSKIHGKCGTVTCDWPVEKATYCRTCWSHLTQSERERILEAIYTADQIVTGFHRKLAARFEPDLDDIVFEEEAIPNPTPVFGEPARIPGLAQLVTTTGEVWR